MLKNIDSKLCKDTKTMVVKGLNYIPIGQTEEKSNLHTKRKNPYKLNNYSNSKFPRRDFSNNISGTLRLHKEIKSYIEKISPSKTDKEIRQQVIDRITKVIHSLWPYAKVGIFGSCLTGLFLPTSDIDIVVFGNWKKRPLHTLCNALVKNGITLEKHSCVVDKAIVPIIKIVDKKTQLKVDISFNVTNGIISAQLIKGYLEEYPMLKSLLLILKQFLLERDLNEVYRGGVGSYTLTLMIVNFLQLHARGEGNLKNANITVLLLEFFELYGINFNYDKIKISTKDDGKYSKRNQSAVDKFSLSLIDPICEDNDVARGSYNMYKVQAAFKHAYKTLSNQITLIHANPINQPTSLLSFIIKCND